MKYEEYLLSFQHYSFENLIIEYLRVFTNCLQIELDSERPSLEEDGLAFMVVLVMAQTFVSLREIKDAEKAGDKEKVQTEKTNARTLIIQSLWHAEQNGLKEKA